MLRLKNQEVLHNSTVVTALNADFLVAEEVPPTQAMAEMVRADARLSECTMLLMSPRGATEKTTRPGGSYAFHEPAAVRLTLRVSKRT